jgi:hypothetical protein
MPVALISSSDAANPSSNHAAEPGKLGLRHKPSTPVFGDTLLTFKAALPEPMTEAVIEHVVFVREVATLQVKVTGPEKLAKRVTSMLAVVDVPEVMLRNAGLAAT